MVIYLALNCVNNKVYVGQTCNFRRRKMQHFSDAFSGGSEVYFHRALRKHGKDAFIWYELEHCDSREDLNTKESHYIAYYMSNIYGYNMDSGGGVGYEKTPERKEHQGKITKAFWASMTPEQRTEHVAKMCAGKEGFSEEGLESLRKHGRERVWVPSEEFRRHARENPPPWSKPIIVTRRGGKEAHTFVSIGEAARFIGTSGPRVSKVVRREDASKRVVKGWEVNYLTKSNE